MMTHKKSLFPASTQSFVGVGVLLASSSLLLSVLLLETPANLLRARANVQNARDLGHNHRRQMQEAAGSTAAIQLPPAIEANLADIWEPYDRNGNSRKDTPIFWHILKSGGTSVQGYSSDCLNLALSNEQGIQFGHGADTVIQVMQVPSERRFINVDSTTRPGIDRAKQLGLAQSGLADIISSPLFPEITDIMNEQHRGRMFTVLRHPIDRASSMFYYLQIADWEPTYEEQFKSWTIEDYARSHYAESNWMVRNMLNKRAGALSASDVEVAAEIMRRKMIVGFMDDMKESILRFESYFGWSAVDYYRRGELQSASECKAKYLDKASGGGSNSNKHPPVLPGTEAHKLLSDLNWADIALYEKAKALFEEQASLFGSTQSTR